MTSFHRRQFLDCSTKTLVQLVARAAVLDKAGWAGAAEGAGAKRPDMMAVYYPHWHNQCLE